MRWRRARTTPDARTIPATWYATAWCPACARLRTCLASSRVAYDERDIERSPEADAQYRELGGGGVPLTLVGADVVHGVDVPALGAALAAAGYGFDCPAPWRRGQ